MITIKNANDQQKAVVKSLLTVLLDITDFKSLYTIQTSEIAICLNENRINPPRSEYIESMSRMMGKTSLVFGEISFSYSPRAVGDRVIGTDFRVHEINETIINEIIVQAEKKPEDINEIIWFFLPDTVKEHWNDLTIPLRAYLVDCVKYSLHKLLDPKADAKVNFYVLLPILKKSDAETAGASSKSDLRYDFLNLLAMERDPEDRNRRRHPAGDGFFSLQEVLPSKDNLNDLVETFIKDLGLVSDNDVVVPAAAGKTSDVPPPSLRP